jgi:hypothetical protein
LGGDSQPNIKAIPRLLGCKKRATQPTRLQDLFLCSYQIRYYCIFSIKRSYHHLSEYLKNIHPMSSSKKLEEAQFFLELLDALDQRHSPLTHIGDTAKEASFLYSAILNSFYSVIAIMRDEEGIDTKAFTDLYPEIYARAKNGGERAKTVHINHIDTAFTGTLFTKGTNFDMPRCSPLLIQKERKPGRADFVIGPKHFMFIELYDNLVHVTKFCFDHFYRLRDFHAKNRVKP